MQIRLFVRNLSLLIEQNYGLETIAKTDKLFLNYD
jgi:hypothetical protein